MAGVELVIKVDKEIYESLKNGGVMISGLRSEKTFISKILTAVANGTLLQKGHGRLGDLDKLEQRISNYIEHNKYHMRELALQMFVLENIKQAGTIIKADKVESEE